MLQRASRAAMSSASACPGSICAFTDKKLRGTRVTFQVIPRARQTQLTSIADEAVLVQLNAPPRDGEANSELIAYVTKLLRLPKSNAHLVSGAKSRTKVRRPGQGGLERPLPSAAALLTARLPTATRLPENVGPCARRRRAWDGKGRAGSRLVSQAARPGHCPSAEDPAPLASGPA